MQSASAMIITRLAIQICVPILTDSQSQTQRPAGHRGGHMGWAQLAFTLNLNVAQDVGKTLSLAAGIFSTVIDILYVR